MKAEVYNTYGAYGRKASSYPKSEDDCHCCCSLSSAAESKINTINKRPQAFRVPRGRVLTRDLIKNKQQHSKLREGETFHKDFGGNEWRRTLLSQDLPLQLRTYSLINNLTPSKNVACWEEVKLDTRIISDAEKRDCWLHNNSSLSRLCVSGIDELNCWSVSLYKYCCQLNKANDNPPL